VPLTEAMRIKGKLENYDRVDEVLDELVASIPEGEVVRKVEAKHIFKELKEKVLRDEVLQHGQRLDGRAFDEVRAIWIETGVLPRVHGSAVFTRGETQALVTCTLGTADDAQKIETFEARRGRASCSTTTFRPSRWARSPSCAGLAGARSATAPWPSVRSCRRCRAKRSGRTPSASSQTSRIERLVVDGIGLRRVAGHDGCGRPAQERRRGIAMGLVMDEKTGKYAVLSDIAGAEDHYGDMDFKVAGTADGITALQMDIKVGGITTEVMRKALDQARRGRLHILEKMRDALTGPRENISTFAPRIITIKIPVDKIRDVIGPGGKMIRSIIERTGVKIDVEDDGRVNVASADETSAQKAISIIQELTATPELNKTYMGKVQRITDFGAFIEIMPGTDGLLHVSEIANHRVKDVRDELKEGEQVMVKVINIDPTGKIRLSRKALLQEEGAAAGAPPPRRS